jgi:cytochrome c551/c552
MHWSVPRNPLVATPRMGEVGNACARPHKPLCDASRAIDGAFAQPTNNASRSGCIVAWLIGLAFCLNAVPAQSQSNLDAGKAPEQIFSDTCSGCHHAPQDLKQPSAQFLRQHYTTGARQAAAMAAYLEKAMNEPPPAPPPPVQSFRRPSESIEMQSSADGPPASLGETSPRAAASIDGFEE